jgi:hypothetical protein
VLFFDVELETALVGGVTRTGLVAIALCPQPTDRHDNLTRRLDAVQAIESAPAPRTLKTPSRVRPGCSVLPITSGRAWCRR